MSEDAIKIEVDKLREEKRLLIGLTTYYTKKVSFQELEELTGFNMREITGYMADNYYPRKSLGGPVDIDHELSVIQKRQSEIDAEIIRVKSRLVEDLTTIMFIPSWSRLIDAQFKGFYAGQQVSTLQKDSVIMLTDLRADVREITGEELILISGPGIYFSEFSLGSGMLIRDHREISALLLPKSVSDNMWNAPPIVHGDHENFTLNELVATIPFDLILESYETQAFIRGVLARNIFLPYQDVFNILNDTCNSANSYIPEEGLKCLSASPLWFNRLLVQDRFVKSPKFSSYSQLTAGLINIQADLDRFLPDIFEEMYLIQLMERITALKQNYSKIGQKILQEWLPE